MRSQVSSSGQTSGSSNQKKSVFDRLGRQIDTGRGQMKRRPSPGQHGGGGGGEYMPPPPPMHDGDYGHYGRGDLHAQAEMEWRYQQERRHMPPFPTRDRHPMQLAPMPPQPPPPGHYEMEVERGQGPYYPPHLHPYHNGPPGPLPHGVGGPSGNMGPMNMLPQRSSPKYDRHGNLIVGFKGEGRPGMMRMGPMEQHHGLSPPRNFMPGPMMGPMHPPPHEMSPMSFPHHRWPDNLEPDFPPHPGGRLMPPMDGGFNPMLDSRRYPPQQQQQMINSLPGHPGGGEFPRYTKWRERRDVITNLDRETAQSSSRTDSLKSTLQQQQQQQQETGTKTGPSAGNKSRSAKGSQKNNDSKEKSSIKLKESSSSDKTTKQPTTKTDPQDISDGEIVDDEDSSDESEINDKSEGEKHSIIYAGDDSYLNRSSNSSSMGPYGRNTRESHQYYEPTKKRRLHDREDYSMDYETISDEDLDDFMENKKISSDGAKLAGGLGEDGEKKSLSEIELLNALGLDWANLVEMARQSKTSTKESSVPGTALKRFSLSNYLPTLGISSSLVGLEIYELITRVCRV